MDAMERARPKLSGRKVAALAELSEGRLRQILNGYTIVGAGNYVATVGPPETVARIAKVVGLTPPDLRAVGRADAADALQDLELQEKYDRPNEALRAETVEIANEVAETLRRLGLDLDSRQERVLRRWSKRLVEDLIDDQEHGEPDKGHEAS
jgi:hypothetical protein